MTPGGRRRHLGFRLEPVRARAIEARVRVDARVRPDRRVHRIVGLATVAGQRQLRPDRASSSRRLRTDPRRSARAAEGRRRSPRSNRVRPALLDRTPSIGGGTKKWLYEAWSTVASRNPERQIHARAGVRVRHEQIVAVDAKADVDGHAAAGLDAVLHVGAHLAARFGAGEADRLLRARGCAAVRPGA